MQTLSSAKRTCMASVSAVECTATVGMPSSLQARSTRNAISPRLAMRILSNIEGVMPRAGGASSNPCGSGCAHWHRPRLLGPRFAGTTERELLDDHQRLAEFDRMAVLEQNLDHGAGARGRNLVHGLHGFDDQQRVAGLHRRADIDERFGARLGAGVSGADHGR